MRNRAFLLVILVGLSTLLAGCPFFTRRASSDAQGAGAPAEAEAH